MSDRSSFRLVVSLRGLVVSLRLLVVSLCLLVVSLCLLVSLRRLVVSLRGALGRSSPSVALVLALVFAPRPALAAGHGSGVGVATPTAAVDLNEASAEALERLPGIGEKRAASIVARREKRPFRSVEELRAIRGIGPKLIRRLRPYLRASPPRARATGAPEATRRAG